MYKKKTTNVNDYVYFSIIIQAKPVKMIIQTSRKQLYITAISPQPHREVWQRNTSPMCWHDGNIQCSGHYMFGSC